MKTKTVLGCLPLQGLRRVIAGSLREGFGLFSLLALLITGSADAQPTVPSTTVVAWGSPFTGGTEVPAGLNGVIGIASGPSISMGWRHDGTAVAWGDVPESMKVPAGLSGVIGLAVVDRDIAAVKNDGTVVAWGFDSILTNVPPGLTGVAAIATGLTHFLALKTDGTVVSWGFDSWANLPIPVTNATPIAAGPGFSSVLRSHGTIGAWGPYVPVAGARRGVPTELRGGNVAAIAAGFGHAVGTSHAVPACVCG